MAGDGLFLGGLDGGGVELAGLHVGDLFLDDTDDLGGVGGFAEGHNHEHAGGGSGDVRRLDDVDEALAAEGFVEDGAAGRVIAGEHGLEDGHGEAVGVVGFHTRAVADEGGGGFFLGELGDGACGAGDGGEIE